MSLRPFPLPNESSQSPHLDQDLAQNQNQDQDQPLSSAPHTEQPTLPPIRACLFDLDGLLINTEDMLEASINTLLKKHGRPCLTREVRTALLGVPDSSNSEWFLAWADLPIDREQWIKEEAAAYLAACPTCIPLPGAVALLEKLGTATSTSTSKSTNKDGEDGQGQGQKISLALASMSVQQTYARKLQSKACEDLLAFIPHQHRVIGGDDERVKRGKPAPDVFLVALDAVNQSLEAEDETRKDGAAKDGAGRDGAGRDGAGQDGAGQVEAEQDTAEIKKKEKIMPNECLVFEDSVVGVQAARRAGMRVVWVPNGEVRKEYEERGLVGDVLAGKVGVGGVTEEIGKVEGVGEVGDGWGEVLGSLEDFEFEQYGIDVR